jgi:hypothetical protein
MITTAFAFGGAGSVRLHENFEIGLEVLYSRKGTKDELSGETLALDYIEIPVLAVGVVPAHDRVDLIGYAGPAVGFNVKAEFAGGAVEDTIAGTDVGGAFGAGAAWSTSRATFTFEARLTVGFLTIDALTPSLDVKNRVIAALVGVMFPLTQGP